MSDDGHDTPISEEEKVIRQTIDHKIFLLIINILDKNSWKLFVSRTTRRI